MANRARIIGVHPVSTKEPTYLVEIEIEGSIEDFDFDEITQEVPDQPRANWQVVYDKRDLVCEGRRARFAFFFHYLDFSIPLLTAFGPVELPSDSPMPDYLQSIIYEQP